jgi:3-oxoacyl-[acyl-carrier-protein] synthase-3
VKYSRIIGTGSYLPEKILNNADLEQMVETTDAWIMERTGIRTRHLAAPGEGTSEMAENAARAALAAAGIGPESLDLIIVGTTTPDRFFPSTACLLQARLGIGGCTAFDVQAVCSGFVYALSVADSFIRTGNARRALVIGAETFSRLVDWSDRGTCVLFGDGAGAVILEACGKPGIRSFHLHADGNHADLLTATGCPSHGALHEGDAYTRMQGSEVFKFAVNSMAEVVEEALAANDLEKEDIDWLVPHQANIRILNAVAKKLKIPTERVVLTVQDHGNTSAASVPLALDTAVRDGRIQRGDTLMLEAMGAGFTWGAVLLTY